MRSSFLFEKDERIVVENCSIRELQLLPPLCATCGFLHRKRACILFAAIRGDYNRTRVLMRDFCCDDKGKSV